MSENESKTTVEANVIPVPEYQSIDYNRDDIRNPIDRVKHNLEISREVRKRVLTQYTERLDYLQKLQHHELIIKLDESKKIMFLEHIKKVSIIERNALEELNNIALKTEELLENSIDKYHEQYNKQKKKFLDLQENEPERAKEGLDRINKRRAKNIKDTEIQATDLLDNHQAIFKETIKLFKSNNKEFEKFDFFKRLL